jgi:cAMP-dependent protein kinase regulator
MANPVEHVPVPASIPAEFPEILRELNRAILKAQPSDIVQFCADYFNEKVKQGGSI